MLELTPTTIVAVALVFVQLFLAIYSYRLASLSKRMFNIPLVSQTTGAELVEKYLRIHEQLNVKVNAAINEIAKASGKDILLNRKEVYKKDLYTTVRTAIALALTDKRFHDLQNNSISIFFFYLEIILMLIGYLQRSALVSLAGIVLSILLIIGSIYRGASFSFVAKAAKEFFPDLLNLNSGEVELAELLLVRESYRFRTYPIAAITTLLSFLNPWA